MNVSFTIQIKRFITIIVILMGSFTHGFSIDKNHVFPKDSISQVLIDKYIEHGSQKLNELIAFNEANELRGEAYKNSYVIDFDEINKTLVDSLGKPYFYNRPSGDLNGALGIKAEGLRNTIEAVMNQVNSTITAGNGKIYVGINMWLGEITYSKEPNSNVLIDLEAVDRMKTRPISYQNVVSKFDEILTFINQQVINNGVLPKCVLVSYAQFRTLKLEFAEENKIPQYSSAINHIWKYQTNGITTNINSEQLKATVNANLTATLPNEIRAYTQFIANTLRPKPLGKKALDFLNYMSSDKFPQTPEAKTKAKEIAEFINDNESLYDMYVVKVKGYDDWMSNINAEQFLGQLNSFFTDLKRFKNQDCSGGLDAELAKENPSAVNIVNALKCCYPWKADCFASLTLDQRIKAIKTLTASGLKDNNLVPGFKTSELVVKIIESIQRNDDQQAFLNRLTTERVNGVVLLHALCKNINGLDGNNFTLFIEKIFEWIKKRNSFGTNPEVGQEIYAKALKDRKYVYITSSFLTNWTVQEFEADGKIKFKKFWKTFENSSSASLDPYEWIVVEFEGGKTIDGITYNRVLVPAIYAYLYASSANSETIIKGIVLAVDVALLFTGVGGVSAGIRASKIGIEVIFGAADIAIGTTDIIIRNTTLYTLLNSTEDGKRWLHWWGIFQMVYGVTSLTSQLGKVALDAYKAGYKAKLNLDLQDITLTESEQANFDKMLNKCLEGKACFLPNTPISTPEGFKNIQDIKTGDIVNAYDELKHQRFYKKVTKTFVKGASKIYDIVVGKDTIHATPEHPFYVNNEKWMIAQQLQKGMKVITLAGVLLPISTISAHDTVATVHNFEVQDAHTYYVGKQQILVHNLCKTLTEVIQSNEILASSLSKIEGWGDKIATQLTDDSNLSVIQDLVKQKQIPVNDALDAWRAVYADKNLVNVETLEHIAKNNGSLEIVFRQDKNAIRSKLSQSAETIAKKEAGEKLEIETAIQLEKDGITLTDVGNKISSNIVKEFNGGQKIAGDIDVATSKILIECKNDLNSLNASDMITQLSKMIGDPSKGKAALTKFVNPSSKKVVLYSGTPLGNGTSLNQIRDYVSTHSDKIVIIDNYPDLLAYIRNNEL